MGHQQYRPVNRKGAKLLRKVLLPQTCSLGFCCEGHKLVDWANVPETQPIHEEESQVHPLGISAVLHGHELRLSLPLQPSVSFTSGRAWPDVRLQVADVHACTTPDRPHSHTRPMTNSSKKRLRGSSCARGGLRGVPVAPAGALLLAYFIFPDQVGPLIRGLAWPGAAALTLSSAYTCIRSTKQRAQENVGLGFGSDGIQQEEDRFVSKQGVGAVSPWRRHKNGGWQEAARVVQDFAGSAAVLRGLGLCWLHLAPGSASIMQASLGLAAVMVEYNSVGRRQRKGLIQAGPQAELAWRNAHKHAAQRLAKHLPKDLPPNKPPLGPALDLFERLSYQAGNAAQLGAGLTGCTVGGGTWGCNLGLLDSGQGRRGQAARLACLGNWHGCEQGAAGCGHPWSMQISSGGPILALSIPLGGMPCNKQGCSASDKQASKAPAAGLATPFSLSGEATPPYEPLPTTLQYDHDQTAAHARNSSTFSNWSAGQPAGDVIYSHPQSPRPCVWQHNLMAHSGDLWSIPSRADSATVDTPIHSTSNLEAAPLAAGALMDGSVGQPGISWPHQSIAHFECPNPTFEAHHVTTPESTPHTSSSVETHPAPRCASVPEGASRDPKSQPGLLSATATSRDPRRAQAAPLAPVTPALPPKAPSTTMTFAAHFVFDTLDSPPTSLSPPRTPPPKTPFSQALPGARTCPQQSPDPSPYLEMPPAGLDACTGRSEGMQPGLTQQGVQPACALQEQTRKQQEQQQEQQQQQQQALAQQSFSAQQQQQALAQQQRELEDVPTKQQLLTQHLLQRQLLRQQSSARRYMSQGMTEEGHKIVLEEEAEQQLVLEQQHKLHQEQQQLVQQVVQQQSAELSAATSRKPTHTEDKDCNLQCKHHRSDQPGVPKEQKQQPGELTAAQGGHDELHGVHAQQQVQQQQSSTQQQQQLLLVQQQEGLEKQQQQQQQQSSVQQQQSSEQQQQQQQQVQQQEGLEQHHQDSVQQQQSSTQQQRQQQQQTQQKLADLGQHRWQQLQRQRAHAAREAAEAQSIAEDNDGAAPGTAQHHRHASSHGPAPPGGTNKSPLPVIRRLLGRARTRLAPRTHQLPHASQASNAPRLVCAHQLQHRASKDSTSAEPILLEPPSLEHVHPTLPPQQMQPQQKKQQSQQPQQQSQQQDGPEPSALFGHADHLDTAPHGPVSWPEACKNTGALCMRALYLLAIFAPFLCLGVGLLLLALACSRKRAGKRRRLALCGPQQQQLGNAEGRLATQQQAEGKVRQQAREADKRTREADARAQVRQLALSQLPPEVAAVLAAVEYSKDTNVHGNDSSWLRWTEVKSQQLAWSLLLLGCRKSGAALIKWGQWAAARPDLFPADFCDAMSTLQDKAPVHSYAHTQKEVEAAFGVPLLTHFTWFDPKPLASGSIAQVHRATMRDPSSNGNVDVVVKVRHPGVAASIYRDFQLLKPLASLASRFRALKGLSLRETVSQFSHTMTAQADLRVEAAHIARFARDLAPVWAQVAVPQLFPGLVTPSVLVESFESGRSVAHFTKSRTPINTQIVSLGVDAYLAMLLKHNFVHTDLHPGNILVRIHDPATGRALTDEESGFSRMLEGQSPLGAQESNSSATSSSPLAPHAQIVLLDFGLAEELTPRVRRHFVAFLNCIAAGDGVRAAEHILQWGVQQNSPNPQAFITAMDILFGDICCIESEKGIDLDQVMKMVLSLASKLEVTIDSSYAALAIGVCVLVGFASSLDPSVNLMDAATPCLLAYALTGRVVGRLYT